MTPLLPKFVTPDDVRAYRGRLDPFARALDRSVALCPALDAVSRRTWSEFFQRWRQFCDGDASWLHASAQYDETSKYEQNFMSWQSHLARVCPIAGPSLTVASHEGGTGSLETTLKVVAISGAVIATALAIRSVAR